MATYNAAVAAGIDPDFGRSHLPAPIAAPPFYAIHNHAITVVTFQGLDIDESFAVRDEAGAPIPGLFASARSSAPAPPAATASAPGCSSPRR